MEAGHAEDHGTSLLKIMTMPEQRKPPRWARQGAGAVLALADDEPTYVCPVCHQHLLRRPQQPPLRCSSAACRGSAGIDTTFCGVCRRPRADVAEFREYDDQVKRLCAIRLEAQALGEVLEPWWERLEHDTGRLMMHVSRMMEEEVPADFPEELIWTRGFCWHVNDELCRRKRRDQMH